MIIIYDNTLLQNELLKLKDDTRFKLIHVNEIKNDFHLKLNSIYLTRHKSYHNSETFNTPEVLNSILVNIADVHNDISLWSEEDLEIDAKVEDIDSFIQKNNICTLFSELEMFNPRYATVGEIRQKICGYEVVSLGRYLPYVKNNYKIDFLSKLISFKFRDDTANHKILTHYIGIIINNYVDMLKGMDITFDTICSVPLKPGKFNRFAEIDNLKSVLALTRDYPDNKSMNLFGRQINIQGVFTVSSATDVRDKKVLLVDDVITSGNTMAEAIKTLYDFGAKEVYAVAVAKTYTINHGFDYAYTLSGVPIYANFNKTRFTPFIADIKNDRTFNWYDIEAYKYIFSGNDKF